MPKKDQDVVPVIFRIFKDEGDLIALFPTIPNDSGGRYVESYQHVGQHGGADLMGVMSASRPAKESEYARLKRELESAPYRYKLEVYQRTAPWMRDELRKELRR